MPVKAKKMGRHTELFKTLDKLPTPDPNGAWAKGLKVYARDSATRYGRATGATSNCTLESCGGLRIAVVWKEGRITRPCSRGMEEHKDGLRIT